MTMGNSILRELKHSLEDARLVDMLGMIKQLVRNLVSKNSAEWRINLTHLLLNSLVSFRHDIAFDPHYREPGKVPRLFSPPRPMSSKEIRQELNHQKLRMGSTEELISYLGRNRDGSAMVFAFLGEHPCAILFDRRGVQFRGSMICNGETTEWGTGCKFLVYPQ